MESKSFCEQAQKEICNLPIFPSLPEIASTLKNSPSRSLVLTAETAAGKSTAVPLALLDAFDGQILMLEPRRLAAVAVASRVADLLSEPVGQTAGYTVHMDSRTSARTRFTVMSEAVLVRRIQQDPLLEGVSAVVLDEFHERTVQGDLALAFLQEARQLRDDLHILVMSATMDAAPIAEFLDTEVFSVKGRNFPVETINIEETPAKSDLCRKAALTAYREALQLKETERTELSSAAGSGSSSASFQEGITPVILVFMPGIAEIRRTQTELLQLTGQDDQDMEVCILHSSIPFQEQKRILAGSRNTPADAGPVSVRIIIASSIAETSLTIPGVVTVIDSGLSRHNLMDNGTGMTRLVTVTESQFSADQRAGRAGRTRKGRCIRLWHKGELRTQSPETEITSGDLSNLVLECSLWGARNPQSLSWLTPPPKSSWDTAQQLLQQLDCLLPDGSITALGKNALSLGVHPRVACVALQGRLNAPTEQSLQAAAKIGAKDSAEQQKLYQHLKGKSLSPGSHQTGSAGTAAPTPHSPGASVPKPLLYGYPDRIAMHLGDGEYQFITGRKARIAVSEGCIKEPWPLWICAFEADAGTDRGRIYKAEVLAATKEDTDSFFAQWLEDHTTKEIRVEFAEEGGGRDQNRIRKTEYTLTGRIVTGSRPLKAEPEDAAAAWCSLVREKDLEALPWNQACSDFMTRAQFFAAHTDASSSVDRTQLAEECAQWLAPFITGSRLSPETVLEALRYRLDGAAIDRQVPTVLSLPNERRGRLHYESISSSESPVPVLEIIIQQMFGVFETPRILGVPVLLRLLSPARRPLQVTSDLESFWQSTWPQICKEMKGRYPKHNWDYTRPDPE